MDFTVVEFSLDTSTLLYYSIEDGHSLFKSFVAWLRVQFWPTEPLRFGK